MDDRTMHRGERGITGLETAIVLIAFVVVAAVFSFVVLSTGLFSAERGKDTVYAGLSKTRGSMSIAGAVTAVSDGSQLTDLVVTVSLAAGGSEVGLDPNATSNRTVISYHDSGVSDTDLAYTTAVLVGDSDTALEPGELIEISIDLTQNNAIDVGENDTFWLEFKPPSGSYLVLQRTVPASISQTNVNLN